MELYGLPLTLSTPFEWSKWLEEGLQDCLCLAEVCASPSLNERGYYLSSLEEAKLRHADLANFGSVTNLLFLGKLVNKMVAMQIQQFLDETDNLIPFQSGFWASYGTESQKLP